MYDQTSTAEDRGHRDPRRPERARIDGVAGTAGKARLQELHKDAHLTVQDDRDLAKIASSRAARQAAAAATSAVAASEAAAAGGRPSRKRATGQRARGDALAVSAPRHECDGAWPVRRKVDVPCGCTRGRFAARLQNTHRVPCPSLRGCRPFARSPGRARVQISAR